MTMTSLVTDPYFDAFSHPLINGKRESRHPSGAKTGLSMVSTTSMARGGVGGVTGDSVATPQLRAVFAGDAEMQALVGGVEQALRSAFEVIQRYIGTFEEITSFYRANELVTVESLQDEREG